MKKTGLLLTTIIIGISASAQQPILLSIDSSLKSIDENVGKLKEELVAEDPTPFTGQSIFEDRKGSSAIFLPYGGTIKLNTADAGLKFSFTNYSIPVKVAKTQKDGSVIKAYRMKPFYGVEITGKTSDGILPLISKGDISPGARANLILGKDLFNKTKNRKNEDISQRLGTLVLKIGYEGSSFKLFNSDSIFANQIRNESFNTFTTSLAFNLKIGGNKLFAISAGYQKVNNYSDLDELELIDTKTIKDTVTNITRTYTTKTEVRTGDYKTSDQVPINIDFFWTPNNNSSIGFYHYWRTKITNGKTTNGFGSGLYLLKKNNPLSSIAGIVFDVSDISKLDEGFEKNFTINFVVGYNFGFSKRKL
jgi:hypothetical protein